MKDKKYHNVARAPKYNRKPLREVKLFSVHTISAIKPRYDIYALNT